MSEQEESIRRRVAFKIIKLGMDTKAVIARFEAERQALAAMLDHPNIAKVFDAGTTDTGRPYFVMELVRGIKITDYCDKNKVTARVRLDLFIQVCGFDADPTGDTMAQAMMARHPAIPRLRPPRPDWNDTLRTPR